ncbi:uncharacterized protein DS421_13g432370 [Arachis hypogaea]|nr:uncharacterized protein DS421_13g432370 [Arachis hypogaea]
MCCNNFHIVIFSGCHLTTAVVFSPVIGVSTLNSCVVIVSILFPCQRCFLKGELCLIPNKYPSSNTELRDTLKGSDCNLMRKRGANDKGNGVNVGNTCPHDISRENICE